MALPTTLKRRLVERLPNTLERGPAALPQTGTLDLFTVTGGRIEIHALIGLVTADIGAVANATKLQFNPDVGGANDLTATSEINGDAAGQQYSVAGIFTQVLGLTGYACSNPPIVPAGKIRLNCAGNDGGGGRIRWTLKWMPFDAGATVTIVAIP
jgi:hypothetical protein